MNDKLPIVKSISYSALSDWTYCPKYYELVNIHRLKPWQNTPDTIYGKLIHQYCQDILQDKITPKDAVKAFERRWKKFCSLFKLPEYERYGPSGAKVLEVVKDVLEEEFGKFKVLEIEYRISLPSGQRWPQMFRGFIDIVLELENGTIIIADFKTTSTAYFFTKYKTRHKDYQLTLYKHFYCLTKNLDPKKVETFFFLLEKNPSKKPVSVLRITSSSKKVANALEWLDTALSAINRQLFLRNRFSCFQYGFEKPCMFRDTEHCPNK